ncbi:hypothetical protein Rsub_00095 [Raphidocelis subcapitata]|uniref:Protein kinase domain-containing protein n=1 Tax=Raphidocelis subcapitata TaxID=307507 RepID=A0A2V0NJJ1_9CHLO|nr:hypothetical protein Rsub_00095 [Raphidocelis subcapitata]|eukprot:GBF87384.1 hypothetical protein Rsub_00095 [Raphidocelis subcapitata]
MAWPEAEGDGQLERRPTEELANEHGGKQDWAGRGAGSGAAVAEASFRAGGGGGGALWGDGDADNFWDGPEDLRGSDAAESDMSRFIWSQDDDNGGGAGGAGGGDGSGGAPRRRAGDEAFCALLETVANFEGVFGAGWRPHKEFLLDGRAAFGADGRQRCLVYEVAPPAGGPPAVGAVVVKTYRLQRLRDEPELARAVLNEVDVHSLYKHESIAPLLAAFCTGSHLHLAYEHGGAPLSEAAARAHRLASAGRRKAARAARTDAAFAGHAAAAADGTAAALRGRAEGLAAETARAARGAARASEAAGRAERERSLHEAAASLPGGGGDGGGRRASALMRLARERRAEAAGQKKAARGAARDAAFARAAAGRARRRAARAARAARRAVAGAAFAAGCGPHPDDFGARFGEDPSQPVWLLAQAVLRQAGLAHSGVSPSNVVVFDNGPGSMPTVRLIGLSSCAPATDDDDDEAETEASEAARARGRAADCRALAAVLASVGLNGAARRRRWRALAGAAGPHPWRADPGWPRLPLALRDAIEGLAGAGPAAGARGGGGSIAGALASEFARADRRAGRWHPWRPVGPPGSLQPERLWGGDAGDAAVARWFYAAFPGAPAVWVSATDFGWLREAARRDARVAGWCASIQRGEELVPAAAAPAPEAAARAAAAAARVAAFPGLGPAACAAAAGAAAGAAGDESATGAPAARGLLWWGARRCRKLGGRLLRLWSPGAAARGRGAPSGRGGRGGPSV